MKGKRETQLVKHKKHHTANVTLVVLAVFLFAFIVTMIVTYWVKGSIPDTLVQCVLGAGGIESLSLAAIKIFKVKSTGATITESEEGNEL